jgi:tetratricopeptide (TPR) repeat protein
MPDPISRLNAALEGRYRIERELGRGGMATVYLAHDAKHDRGVALKVFRPELAVALGGERFLNEIKVTANLQHPHILPLFDSGGADSMLYYVMPHVKGETLKERLEREGPLPIEEGVSIAKFVAAALHYAHRHNVIHRDIKPENVMLSDGLPVVADFGIAGALDAAGGERLTQTGLSLGTPGYMSPEQAAGDPVDARSDVYALGCLLFEMVTGEPPYSGPTAQSVLVKVLTEAVPSTRALRDGVPEALDAVIRRALAKEPAERYATAAELAAALDGGSSQPVQVREALAIAPSKRTPFVARQEERAQLIAALDDAVQGQGSLVLVGGEPGVGKTRLAEEILLEAQRRELLCFIGHSYEGEGTAPYTPFVETLEYAVRALPEDVFRQALGDSAPEVARIMPKLRRMFPDIPPAIELPAEEQRRYLFNSYREFVERGTQISPLVVLLDDLHWADESSLLLLEHLAQHIPTQRMLIIATYRDVELEVTRPFAKTLSNLTRQRLAQRIMIRRLSQDSVAELLAALGGPGPPPRLAASIFHETEGNPFFVEEVFRDLDEEGKLFDALEAAEDAHLIQPESAGRDTVYKFSHELIRQTLVGRLSIPGRQRLHLRISKAMEEVYASHLEDHAADYSYHLYQAGAAADPDTTIRFLALAGQQALEAAAFEEALEHFELGLSVVEDPKPEQLAELLRKKGEAARGLGDWSAALEAWKKAMPLFEELGESEAVAQMSEEAGIIMGWRGQPDEWREIVSRGLAATGDEASVRRGRLLAQLGLCTALTSDPAGGLAMLDDAARLGRDLEDEPLLGYALHMKALALHNHARFEAEMEVGREGIEVLRSINDQWNLVELLCHMEFASLCRGRVPEALNPHAEVSKLADDLGHVGAALLDEWTSGAAEYLVGAARQNGHSG